MSEVAPRLMPLFEITAGDWTVRAIDGGAIALDGGAMFGSVPRPMWGRLIPPDGRHRIPLALRLLLLENERLGRRVLVDGGVGDKEDEAFRDRFGVDGAPLVQRLAAGGVEAESITDVIVTHLHFDHAGGLTRLAEDGSAVAVLPGTRHHLQVSNRDNGLSPSVRERASYLRENIEPFLDGLLELSDGDGELFPGVRVERCDGHTVGMQTIRIEGGGVVVRYLADLAPTHHHLRIPFTMGYDICATTVMEEKQRMLDATVEEDAILVFEHDIQVAAARLVEEKGRWVPRPLEP